MLRFRSLAAGAALCLCAGPLVAQGTDTTTTRTDSSAMRNGTMNGDSAGMHRRMMGRRSRRSMSGNNMNAGSASVGSTNGIGRIELLALKQQLRDDGCGLQHVSGGMNSATRAAIRRCMTKYNVTSGGVQALIDSMHIGFGPGATPPSLSEARAGGSMNGGMSGSSNSGMNGTMSNSPSTSSSMSGSNMNSSNGTMNNGTRRRGMRRGMRNGAMRDSTRMMRDSTGMMMHDSTGTRPDSTGTTPPSTTPPSTTPPSTTP